MKRTITRDFIGIPCIMKVRLYQWVTAVYRGLRKFISRRTKVVTSVPVTSSIFPLLHMNLHVIPLQSHVRAVRNAMNFDRVE